MRRSRTERAAVAFVPRTNGGAISTEKSARSGFRSPRHDDAPLPIVMTYLAHRPQRGYLKASRMLD
jgi:hypothetical protein